MCFGDEPRILGSLGRFFLPLQCSNLSLVFVKTFHFFISLEVVQKEQVLGGSNSRGKENNYSYSSRPCHSRQLLELYFVLIYFSDQSNCGNEVVVTRGEKKKKRIIITVISAVMLRINFFRTILLSVKRPDMLTAFAITTRLGRFRQDLSNSGN